MLSRTQRIIPVGLAGVLFVFQLLACGDPVRLPGRSNGAKQIRVAAVQYALGAYDLVAPECVGADSPDNCAVHRLVDRAAEQGALLVVTPEYGVDQSGPESIPRVGQNPSTTPSWPGPLLRAFSRQAAHHGIYLVINLLTTGSADGQRRTYNTQVAFGPDGAVNAVHHKLTLFDGEAGTLTPGRDVTAFRTPFGTVGLLICADLYGDLRQHQRLVQHAGARLIAVSSAWTATGGARWPRSFARNWGVHVVSANTTAGPGAGGGVFDPNGQILAKRSVPGLAMAWINLP